MKGRHKQSQRPKKLKAKPTIVKEKMKLEAKPKKKMQKLEEDPEMPVLGPNDDTDLEPDDDDGSDMSDDEEAEKVRSKRITGARCARNFEKKFVLDDFCRRVISTLEEDKDNR